MGSLLADVFGTGLRLRTFRSSVAKLVFSLVMKGVRGPPLLEYL